MPGALDEGDAGFAASEACAPFWNSSSSRTSLLNSESPSLPRPEMSYLRITFCVCIESASMPRCCSALRSSVESMSPLRSVSKS